MFEISSISSSHRRLASSIPEYTAIVTVVGMGMLFFGVLFLVTKVISALYSHFMKKRIVKALLARRETGDTFRTGHGYSWDYVMAFHIYDEDEELTVQQREWNLRRILAQLSSGGLEFRLFYNRMHNTLYVKIRATPQRLQKEAARINMVLELDEDSLRTVCREGRKSHGWGPIETPENSNLTSLSPFKHIYCPYVMNGDGTGTRPDLAQLYKTWKTVQLMPPGAEPEEHPDIAYVLCCTIVVLASLHFLCDDVSLSLSLSLVYLLLSSCML